MRTPNSKYTSYPLVVWLTVRKFFGGAKTNVESLTQNDADPWLLPLTHVLSPWPLGLVLVMHVYLSTSPQGNIFTKWTSAYCKNRDEILPRFVWENIGELRLSPMSLFKLLFCSTSLTTTRIWAGWSWWGWEWVSSSRLGRYLLPSNLIFPFLPLKDYESSWYQVDFLTGGVFTALSAWD